MKREVKISNKARKQLKQIPLKDGRRILIELQKLAETEVGLDIKALAGHKYGFRMRVGRYRVLFNKKTAAGQIVYEIQEVKHRREAY